MRASLRPHLPSASFCLPETSVTHGIRPNALPPSPRPKTAHLHPVPQLCPAGGPLRTAFTSCYPARGYNVPCWERSLPAGSPWTATSPSQGPSSSGCPCCVCGHELGVPSPPSRGSCRRLDGLQGQASRLREARAQTDLTLTLLMVHTTEHRATESPGGLEDLRKLRAAPTPSRPLTCPLFQVRRTCWKHTPAPHGRRGRGSLTAESTLSRQLCFSGKST